MKVHLIKKETLEAFAKQNAQSRAGLEERCTKVRYADWNIPGDLQSTFSTADMLGSGSNRVVFDVAGNRYRMIAKYAFGSRQVHLFVCWIGTHAEYDKLCKAGEQYSVSDY